MLKHLLLLLCVGYANGALSAQQVYDVLNSRMSYELGAMDIKVLAFNARLEKIEQKSMRTNDTTPSSQPSLISNDGARDQVNIDQCEIRLKAVYKGIQDEKCIVRGLKHELTNVSNYVHEDIETRQNSLENMLSAERGKTDAYADMVKEMETATDHLTVKVEDLFNATDLLNETFEVMQRQTEEKVRNEYENLIKNLEQKIVVLEENNKQYEATRVSLEELVLSLEGAGVIPIKQWVSAVVDFSPQWDSTGASANQVIGPYNVYPSHGWDSGAWFAFDHNPWIEVKFEEKVFVDEVEIYETYSAGGVKVIKANCDSSGWLTLWATSSVSVIRSARIFSPELLDVRCFSNHLRIELAAGGYVRQIDAIRLTGRRK